MSKFDRPNSSAKPTSGKEFLRESIFIHEPSNVAAESFRMLIENVKDYGIFLLDAKGYVKSWNPGAERIKGYKPHEVIGKHFSMFYTPEDQERKHPDHELEIAILEGRYEEEGWRVRKDGSRFWTNIVITPIQSKSGECIGFAKVTRDLSERKVAEDALRASEEQARLVYESVKDYAIITLDPKGFVTTWNEGARRIKGYEAKEILGKHFSVFYSPEEIETGKCEYELVEAAITGRFEDEGWRVRSDGTKFWANIILTALYDKSKKLTGYSKVTRDMTERKRAEDRLKMMNESLERRVEERTQALRLANDSLKNEVLERRKTENELNQAVRARDEFLSIASHELRTPVTPLRLQLQGILSHLRKGTLAEIPADRLEKMAGTIDRSLIRLSKLIDNLLDVARINAGKISLHPESIDVTEVLNETIARFHQEAKINGGDVILHCDQQINGFLDRIRLEQVVANLTVNAIKYGEGNLIEVSAQEEDGKLVVQVKDQGIGIADTDMSRIFNRFEQINKNMGTTGLGLGLYITKQIVDAQGGTIEVSSKLKQGTIFTVKLPLHLAQ